MWLAWRTRKMPLDVSALSANGRDAGAASSMITAAALTKACFGIILVSDEGN
jgi:hypothetical protein